MELTGTEYRDAFRKLVTLKAFIEDAILNQYQLAEEHSHVVPAWNKGYLEALHTVKIELTNA